MDAAAVSEFAQASACNRQALWGSRMLDVATGREFRGVMSAISSTRQLEAGGWQPTVTTTLRIVRSSAPWLTPALGQIVRLVDGAYFTIQQIRNNPSSPEWVLGLSDDESRP